MLRIRRGLGYPYREAWYPYLARRCLPGDPVSIPRSSVSLPAEPVSLFCPADAYRETRYRYRRLDILTERAGIDISGPVSLPGGPVSLSWPADAYRKTRYRYPGLGSLTRGAGILILACLCLPRDPVSISRTRYPYRESRHPYLGPQMLTRRPGIDTRASVALPEEPVSLFCPCRCLPGDPATISRTRYPYRESRHPYLGPQMLTGRPGIDTAGLYAGPAGS